MIEPSPRPTNRAQLSGTQADARKTNRASITAVKFLIAASKKMGPQIQLERRYEALPLIMPVLGTVYCALRQTR